MKLNEFIEKIRYRSLKITITTRDDVNLYDGTIGTYLTSVFRQQHGEKIIFAVLPIVDELIIQLSVRSDQLCEH